MDAFDSYYFSFDPTGVDVIDNILKAVARAGKMYHSTDEWSDKQRDGKSCVDLIQEAAEVAAKAISNQNPVGEVGK